MQYLEQFVNSASTALWSYILIILLIGTGLLFSIKTQFMQFRYFGETIRLLTEGKTKRRGISSFQAFCISTASRVGSGNIAGVAIAIVSGGPGAVFWMWLIALIGASSAFVESVLAQIYKERKDGAYVGGPAYYMQKGLKSHRLGIFFAVLITVCYGLIFNAVQANTIGLAFVNAFSLHKELTGILLAVFTAAVIFGGVRRVAQVAQVIVPVMALAYLLVVFYVIIQNIEIIPKIVFHILENALGIKPAAGGALGAAIRQGIKRGLFSNEAGMGSAPNAAATAEVSHPVKQGLIQTLGVFTDTIVICSATAFLILISGSYLGGNFNGIELAQTALVSQVGNWGTYFIAFCIFLFAFSSVVGNYYYGESNIEFFHSGKKTLALYRLAVVGMVVFGTIAKLQIVWDLADLFMGLMAMINIYAIIRLHPIAIKAFRNYQKQKKSGRDPTFYAEDIEVWEGADCWSKITKA